MAEKKEYVSKVTGEVWHKENIKNYKRWFEKVAVILEDCHSKQKNGENAVLIKGSKVLITDIRGRIKPQYKVTDASDRIWFVPIEKVEIIEEKTGEKING
jgi:hypothetical protein